MSGTPFIMSGIVVGAIFDVAGTISGQSMEALGLYDLVNNDFVTHVHPERMRVSEEKSPEF